LEFYHKSFKLREENGFTELVAKSLTSLGSVYLEINKSNEALTYTKRALSISQTLGFPEEITNAAELMSKIYEKQGKGMLALEMYKLHITMRDSINNEETQKVAVQQQAKYEYEKQKTIDDADHEKQLAIEQEAKAKQKVITYSIALGLVLVVLFLIFVFNRLQVTKKQRDIIEQQKTEVEKQKAVVEVAHILLEEKNAEIIASIRYAKRIQDALMTSQKYIERNINRLKTRG
jgi:tetratricopeptide (TPR) repeat protein